MTRRRLGQHFLVDGRAIGAIVRAARPLDAEPLLEIGPGRGALTAPLLAEAPRLAAIELDPRLASRLAERFGPRLVLLRDDVLRVPLSRVLQRLERPADERLVVVGNLPYGVSKPVCMKLIDERERVERAVLMFQQEVAARLLATPGGRDYGPLTVLSGALYAIERLVDLPPGAFRPPPAVRSTVTVWRRRHPVPDAAALARLRRCLVLCFRARRKTLRNNLRAVLDEPSTDRLLGAVDIDGMRRPATLTPRELRALADAWPGLPRAL